MLSRKPEAINGEDYRSQFGDVLWCIARAGERRSLRQHLISMTSDWGSLRILLVPNQSRFLFVFVIQHPELQLKTMGESTPFSEQLLFIKSLFELRLNPTPSLWAPRQASNWCGLKMKGAYSQLIIVIPMPEICEDENMFNTCLKANELVQPETFWVVVITHMSKYHKQNFWIFPPHSKCPTGCPNPRITVK